MDVSGGGGSATSRAAAEFARSASLKLADAGAGKTRTQSMIEQINAERARAGPVSPLLGGGVLSEMTKMQARNS